jgi:hypothetical protein
MMRDAFEDDVKSLIHDIDRTLQVIDMGQILTPKTGRFGQPNQKPQPFELSCDRTIRHARDVGSDCMRISGARRGGSFEAR